MDVTVLRRSTPGVWGEEGRAGRRPALVKEKPWSVLSLQGGR